MPTLASPQTAVVSVTTPNQVYRIKCLGATDVMLVSWVGTGGVSGQQTIRATTTTGQDVGPFQDDTAITFRALSGSPAYENLGPVTATEGGSLIAGGRVIAPRPRIALLGDSIMAAATNYGATRFAAGAINWALARLGQPWFLPRANNFAVNGTTVDVMLANQLPNLLAANASGYPIQRCFISAGTNDTNSGRSLTTIKNDLTTLFESMLAVGITPVHHGILPRGSDGAVTNPKLANMHLNEWLAWYAYTRGGLEFIDCGLGIADNANAAGNALSTMTDGTQLHPFDNGAFWIGKIMADYYAAKGVGRQARFATSQADKFDATYNPTGVIFDNPNPLLQGGTSAPTDMSTSGGTWTMTTQTLANGQTKPMASCALAASATHYLYDDALGPASAAWTGSRIAMGDFVYAEAEIELVNCTAMKAVELRIAENAGAGAITTGDLVEASGTTGATGASLTLTLQTPPVQIRAYAGSGQPSVFVQQRYVSGAGETGTMRVKAFEMRKWVGEV